LSPFPYGCILFFVCGWIFFQGHNPLSQIIWHSKRKHQWIRHIGWYIYILSQPHFEGSVRSPLTLPKMRLGSPPRLSKNSEDNCRGQNTLHRCVLYTVEKVLKCRCQKWPCMSHFDVYNTNYGWKKGQKSNWQFDSRPLKVKNRPDPDVCRWSATHRWKALKESYKFALDLVPIGGWGEKLWTLNILGVQTRTVSGPFWESQEKVSFGCKCGEEMQRILYGGRWWLPPSSGRGESSESKVARDLS